MTTKEEMIKELEMMGYKAKGCSLKAIRLVYPTALILQKNKIIKSQMAGINDDRKFLEELKIECNNENKKIWHEEEARVGLI